MSTVYAKNEIMDALAQIDLVAAIENAFVAHSSGAVASPLPGELLPPAIQGEMHVKYGVIVGGSPIVVKIATGFAGNRSLGLPNSNGCLIILSAKTGEVTDVLLDEGALTAHRTAAAGAVVARYFARPDISRIAIIGTGEQAVLQARYLKDVTDCRRLAVWGRSPDRAAHTAEEIASFGFDTQASDDLTDLVSDAGLIVTTTASTQPLIDAAMISPGTHITAIGSDTPEKRELSSDIVGLAERVVVDCRQASAVRGEVYQALRTGALDSDRIEELGGLIASAQDGPLRSDADITVADLTGLPVQDIAIATAIVAELEEIPT